MGNIEYGGLGSVSDIHIMELSISRLNSKGELGESTPGAGGLMAGSGKLSGFL